MIGKLRPAVDGKAVRQAPYQRRLAKLNVLFLAAVAAIARRRGRVFQPPFTLQNWHSGIRHAIASDAAIGLFYLNAQITAAGRGVKVVNGKCAGRDVALVDGVAILPNGHLGIAFSDTVDGRCEAFHTVRQHVVIGSQLNAAKGQTVEDRGRRIAISCGQFAFQSAQIALYIRADMLPVAFIALAAAVIVPGGIVTQAPGAKVQAAVKAKKQGTGINAALAAIAAIRTGKRVIKQ